MQMFCDDPLVSPLNHHFSIGKLWTGAVFSQNMSHRTGTAICLDAGWRSRWWQFTPPAPILTCADFVALSARRVCFWHPALPLKNILCPSQRCCWLRPSKKVGEVLLLRLLAHWPACHDLLGHLMKTEPSSCHVEMSPVNRVCGGEEN